MIKLEIFTLLRSGSFYVALKRLWDFFDIKFCLCYMLFLCSQDGITFCEIEDCANFHKS